MIRPRPLFWSDVTVVGAVALGLLIVTIVVGNVVLGRPNPAPDPRPKLTSSTPPVRERPAATPSPRSRPVRAATHPSVSAPAVARRSQHAAVRHPARRAAAHAPVAPVQVPSPQQVAPRIQTSPAPVAPRTSPRTTAPTTRTSPAPVAAKPQPAPAVPFDNRGSTPAADGGGVSFDESGTGPSTAP